MRSWTKKSSVTKTLPGWSVIPWDLSTGHARRLQEHTKRKVRDVYLCGGDDDCAKDDEDYEVWVVEYYPDESPSNLVPSGAGV